MSHFTVMVIGDDAEKQLAPYHEYECTGNDDEYVIDVDCTDEVREWLDKPIWVGISKESGESDYWPNEKSGIEHLKDPEPMSRQLWFESINKDIEEEIDDWFGYKKDEDGKYFRHTNPNAKWDWYQVGGRWSGFFKVKNPEEGEMGDRSWMDHGKKIPHDRADITTKGNVDIVGMQASARINATEQFDNLEAAIGQTEPVSWTATLKKFENDGKTAVQEARDYYHATPFQLAIKKYEKEHNVHIGSFRSNVYDDYYLHLPLNVARVRFVETAAMNVITPYAIVKDGQWYERGEMGWWGMASNEKEKDVWTEEFYKMFSELPDDTVLTMVDCHI